MSLHVLQLGPYPPPEGGISHNMLAIRDELAARGHGCSIIATSHSTRRGAEADVYHPRSALALMRLLFSIKFDVLHLHIGGEIGFRVLALAAIVSGFARGRCVLTLHSGAYPLTEAARNAAPRSIRGRIFRRFSRIVAVNSPIADVFRRYGVEPQGIKIIPPFALKMPDENVDLPAKIQDFLANHKPLLVSVGGLERDYDPIFQVSAMANVLTKFPKAGMIVVGGGSMAAEVSAAVSESGYADNIILAGDVEHAHTLHLIDKADVLIRTTLFDGDAISVREAMFLGTPVVATDNGMRPDGVRLYDAGDQSVFVREVAAAVMAGKTGKPPSDPDYSNIRAVVDLYEGLN